MTRRADGLWQEKLPIVKDGKTSYKYFYGKTKTDVNRKIAAYREEQERGVRFGLVADEWWEQHEPTLAHNTVKQYSPALVRAKERFAEVDIRTIKPPDISRFLRACIGERSMADKTARTQLMVVNLILHYAVECGYVDANAARDISVPRGLTKEKRGMPSDEDIRRIKSSVGLPNGLFAYWLLYTGMRKGELLALTWEDVDMNARTITVSKSVYHDSNKPCVKEPKTEAGCRKIPVLNRLAEVIEPGEGLIFHNAAGTHLTEMQYQKMWKEYSAAAGISCTAHQLRHAYATMLYECEIPVKDAQNLLGHAQASTTQDIYTEIRKVREAETAKRLMDADLL